MAFFPMMMDLQDRRCLVVGGGLIAAGKTAKLAACGADITLVAPQICAELCNVEGMHVIHQAFCEELLPDLEDYFLAIVATGDRATNAEVADILRKKRILVNTVDQPEDCDFIFPAYIQEGALTAAFSSGGSSPVLAQYMKKKAAAYITPELAQLALTFGEERMRIKIDIPDYHMRREYYNRKIEEYEQNRHRNDSLE